MSKCKFSILTDFQDYLDTNQIKYRKNYNIKYETYFKMGGLVNSFVMPININELKKILIYLNDMDIEYKIIGLTTNIYFLDELEYGVIISTTQLNSLNIISNSIEVECGYSIEKFVRVALLNSSSGYEGLEGIPGTIGAGIVMNAGAYGDTISDNIISIDCLTPDNEYITLNKVECKFEHRNSLFRNNKGWIVLSAKFKIIKGKQNNIAKKMEQYHIARHTYQEFAYPTLGSLFSVKGDFYKSFLHKSISFSILLYILKLIYKNPISKFISRRNPNNKILNQLINIYIKPQIFNHKYSSKSMNILVNDGYSNKDEILNYITLLKENLLSDDVLENEILISPILNEDVEIEDFIEKIKSIGLST